MSDIHATAVIEDGASLGEDVSIGPFCHVGANVKLGDEVTLHAHVVAAGDTTIGDRTTIFPFASIGHAPQDKKFSGEKSTLEIGTDNVIREHVTMNPGTYGGGLVTRVGSSCLFMAGSHVAHDCQIGDHVILANNATVAGHCTVGDFVILGGLCAIHQFVRVGEYAFVGGMSGIENDVIPYGMAIGNRAFLSGLNIVGLKRQGFEREKIHDLRKAYRLLFATEGTLKERVDDVDKMFGSEPGVAKILEFIRADSSRSLCMPAALAN
ncbi:MAG: acyl-ACP--UDP-N-acetylglucosamine O-acyltransferase [Hyphomicrobiaceae bacterium]